MKRLLTVTAGAAPLIATDTAWAQNGSVVNGGMWGGGWMGGYGGIWGLAPLVIVVAAVVACAVKRKSCTSTGAGMMGSVLSDELLAWGRHSVRMVPAPCSRWPRCRWPGGASAQRRDPCP